MTDPVRYSPAVEQPASDEAETIVARKEQFRIILDTTSKDYGHTVWSVHAKGHGLAKGRLTVAGDLPPKLAQGISETTEEALSFSPWHGLVAHQPLGGINRARTVTYAFPADYRERFNGCPIQDP